ncbi:hypothetical protein D3C71_1990230 [compost metagenome]
MIPASIQLLFLEQLNYGFKISFVFGSVLLYFFSTSLVFHKYRHAHQRLRWAHGALFLGVLVVFLGLDLMFTMPNYVIIGEMALFFVVYAKGTT